MAFYRRRLRRRLRMGTGTRRLYRRRPRRY